MSDHLSRVTRVKKYIEINYFDINASKIERFGKTNMYMQIKIID